MGKDLVTAHFVKGFEYFCYWTRKELQHPNDLITIEHERHHKNKGLELGCIPRGFTLWIYKDGSYKATTNFYKSIKDKDLIAICLAPPVPSEEDKEMALNAWARIQERRYFLG